MSYKDNAELYRIQTEETWGHWIWLVAELIPHGQPICTRSQASVAWQSDCQPCAHCQLFIPRSLVRLSTGHYLLGIAALIADSVMSPARDVSHCHACLYALGLYVSSLHSNSSLGCSAKCYLCTLL